MTELERVVIDQAGSTNNSADLAHRKGSLSLELPRRASESGRVKADRSTGLEAKYVERLRLQYGYNDIPIEKPAFWRSVVRKFWGVSPWILEGTIVASLALQKWIQAGIVAGLLVVNAIIGLVQETRASVALTKLQQQLEVSARVLRDGQWTSIPARELVPGDILRVRQGDVVPADLLLLDGALLLDQSALTGESVAIERNIGEEAYSGSVVKNGESKAEVAQIGRATMFGKTIQLVNTSTPKLHVEQLIMKFVWANMASACALILIVIIVQLAVDRSQFVSNIPLFLTLLLSAVPVALPAMFTITMALGSMSLSKQGVLISRLGATEDSASMDVLCTDKTGTLTTNRLSLHPEAGFTDADLLRYGSLCSRAENQDAIDTAVLEAAEKAGVAVPLARVVRFVPFSAKIRRTEANLLLDGTELLVRKGAVDVILADCDLPEADLQRIKGLVVENAEVAEPWQSPSFKAEEGPSTRPRVVEDHKSKDDDNKGKERRHKKKHKKHGKKVNDPGDALSPTSTTTTQLAASAAPAAATRRHRFVGLIALDDPPRGDSKSVIGELHDLGIRVIMLTGDALQIAKEIGKSVGLGDQISGLAGWRKEKEAAALSGSAGVAIPKLEDEQTSGFAEVFPEDKHTIVVQLQRHGHIVGMTGDGVNDAPALRQAEVGVAVSNATDVAKSAASAVLIQDGLGGVPHLVKVGRIVHARIVTYLLNKVIKTFQTVAFVCIVYMIRQQFIVAPLNLLLLVFLVDFVSIALAGDVASVSPLPSRWDIVRLTLLATVMGIANVIESLALLYYGLYSWDLRNDIDQVYTFSTEILFFFGIFTTLMVRERRWCWRSLPSISLLVICAADAVLLVLLCSFGVSWLSLTAFPVWRTFVVIGWAAGCCFLINDVLKVTLVRNWLKRE